MYQKVVEGKGGIIARIVADSVSEAGDRITTFEIEYPRFIHSELMTHRLFSRNAMSSRAVPIEKMIEQVRKNPAMPIHWGKNQAGMQSDIELNGEDYENAKYLWDLASKHAVDVASWMANHVDVHKQIVNRLLEPFQMMKTVLTATEFDNFFWLRCHSDAQPEIHELADCMFKAYSDNVPELLREGEWHTPYVDHNYDPSGEYPMAYHMEDEAGNLVMLTKEDALKVSASCCAQVSYRVLDDSLDKALMIYDKLVESKPVHASPFEHQAKPMSYPVVTEVFELHNEKGMTHVDNDMNGWSGNFKGWIQHRQLIKDNVCWDYEHN